MSRFTSASVLAAGVLVTTWVSAPAAPTAPPREVSAADVARIVETAPLVAALDQEVARLSARSDAPAEPREPRRDPFAFGAPRPAPRTPILLVPDAPTVVEMTPVVMWPTLAAIMDGAQGNTAVLAWGDSIELLKAGETHRDFRVITVSTASIDVRHESTGALRTLSLR